MPLARRASLIAALLLASPALAAPAAKGARDAPADELALHLSLGGCRVLVDGREVAAAAPQDLRLPLPAGEHLVRVEHEGFEPYEQKVSVQGPTRLEVLLKVAAAPPAAPAPTAAPAPAPARAAGPIRVAVYEARAQTGIEQRVIKLVSEALLAEIRKLERVGAVSTSEISDMLSFEQQRQLLGCGDDECLAEISGALGVDELVNVTLGSVGDSNVFTLKRIDMRRASVKGSSNRRFKAGTGEEFLAAIGPAVEEAFPDYPLRAGRTRGVSAAVVARLNPPPLPRWAFFTTAGATVAAAAFAGGFGLAELSAEADHKAAADRALKGPVDGWELQSYRKAAESRAKLANIGWIATGVFGLAAGIEALFTDWHGYRDAAAGGGDGVSLRPVPGGVAGTF